jgi:hypothetical protein
LSFVQCASDADEGLTGIRKGVGRQAAVGADEVFVRNAQPVFASAPGAPVGTRMGSVLSVDPSNALISVSRR